MKGIIWGLRKAEGATDQWCKVGLLKGLKVEGGNGPMGVLQVAGQGEGKTSHQENTN